LIAALAAALAWIGACLIVLADGRRGLTLGLALTSVGLAAVTWAAGDNLAAGTLLVGGLIASAQRLRSGPAGWTVMPPGSTPRLVLCVASGLLALWIAAAVTSGPGAAARFGVLSVIGLTGARAITGDRAWVVLSAVAGLALAVATAASFAEPAPGPTLYVAGALIAAAASFVRVRETRRA
jgi:hypothetical protein